MSHTKGVTAHTAHPCSTCDHPIVNGGWWRYSRATPKPGHKPDSTRRPRCRVTTMNMKEPISVRTSDSPTAPVMGHDPVTNVPLCEHGDDAAACQLAHAKPATATSTLRPTYGAPHDSESLDGCEGVGWDLSWGFRLNVGHDEAEDPNSPLTIGASFSDSDQANGIVVRETTPEQLEEFARLLLNIAAKQRARGDRCQRCGQEDVDGVRWVDMVDQCVADVCPFRDGTATRPYVADGGDAR